jgi:putative membrane protein insertion efficiency factor
MVKIVISLLLVLFIENNVYGEDLMRSPDIQEKREARETSTSYSPLSIFLDGSVRFFQNFISPVDGDRCSMYPTCSAYSREAIRKYGAIKGFVMTADRLIHEMDEARFASLIRKENSLRFYDPPENNDFWHFK